MRRSFSLAVIVVVLAVAPLRASCGSASCPIDLNALNAPLAGQIGFDLSFQYINQNHAMIGTHNVAIGAIPTDHVEVQTINRIATGTLTYAASRDLQLSASLPFVSRHHDHLENGVTPESWNLNSIGDVMLQSRYRLFASQRATGAGLWVIAGIKLPTGPHDLKNSQGEPAEVTLQPGTGTTDGIVGLSWQTGFRTSTGVHGAMGDYGVVPLFATATYQFRHGDVDGYRVGNDFQVSAGMAYPLAHGTVGLLQINGRVREQDRMVDGTFNPDTFFTGGSYVYLSPGVRVDTHGVGVYALLQVPVYQHVNALQLTSRANLIAGVQHRFR